MNKPRKITTLGGTILLLIVAFVVILLTTNKESKDMIPCPADARLCPDGSSVGRTGPDCKFTPCPDFDGSDTIGGPGEPPQQPIVGVCTQEAKLCSDGSSVGRTGPDCKFTECPQNNPKSYVDISPQKAKELIDNSPDVVIIDVSPHYKKGHIPGSINHYLGDGSLDRAIPSLDKNRTYLVYCHVDSVSIAGAQKLIDADFKTVYRLEGNYSAWVDAGYPVEK